MFAGHVGAALAIGRAERRINVGVFVLAAILRAWSSLGMIVLVCALASWIGWRKPAPGSSPG